VVLGGLLALELTEVESPMEDDSLLLEFCMSESAWYATVHTQGINNVTVKSMYVLCDANCVPFVAISPK